MAFRTWEVPAGASIENTIGLGTYSLGDYTLSINFNYDSITRSTLFTVAE